MTWFERHFFRDFYEEYPKYCFEHLADEWERLRRPSNGKTGVEAFIAADKFKAVLLERLMGEEQKQLWGKQPKHAIDALTYIVATAHKKPGKMNTQPTTGLVPPFYSEMGV